jgi:hypothetical protein
MEMGVADVKIPILIGSFHTGFGELYATEELFKPFGDVITTYGFVCIIGTPRLGTLNAFRIKMVTLPPDESFCAPLSGQDAKAFL